jgi:peptide chain release factor 2
MLLDDLREQLKALEPALTAIKTFWANANFESEFVQLQTATEQEDFWKDSKRVEIQQALQAIKIKREEYLSILTSYDELKELVDLFSADENELTKLAPDIKQLTDRVTRFKIALLLNEPSDASSCFLNINAGAGGTESMDWASMLLRMYVRFCEDNNLNAQIIDYQPGEQAGIKSATLFIKGKNAYGLMRSEHGIHRLVRISPYDSAKRRHTSFAAISAIPEAVEQNITIEPKDLRIDTYRAGGAGGQHVNKTESAVRITHLPTNTVTQCQSERSQHQNKETAMKMLIAKLAQKQKEEQLAQQASIEKKNIEWGSQIRSYVLHPYKMVKDHRTEHESPQPDKVLDGELMPFIEAYLLSLAKGS